MTDVVVHKIEEHVLSGRRLGRHVEHDPRSRAYGFGAAATPSAFGTVTHRRYGPAFDQGDLGSCTGNACAGAINTKPIHVRGQRLLSEADAVELYANATELDDISGTYPPDDTGSSGLAVAKAAKRLGLIKGYRHAFNLEEALTALQLGPVITGVDWYEGFDDPDPNGFVKLAGQPRGGHEFEVVGFEYHTRVGYSLVIAENSWGSKWGNHGRFMFTVDTWRQLLASQGDVTILWEGAFDA